MEFLLLVAGAIVGVVAQKMYDIVQHSWTHRSSSKKARLHTDRASFTPRFDLSEVPEGFQQATTSGGVPLPIVEPEAPSNMNCALPEESHPLLFVPTDSDPEASDADLTRFERVTGRILHDGTCCYLSNGARSLLSSSFEVTAGRFKEYLETYIPALKQRGDRNHNSNERWNTWAADFLKKSMTGEVRLQIGCAMGLVQEINGEWSLLQHRRSDLVAITPGLVTATPVFGIEPSNRLAHTSRLGLLQYNMLREIGEELFSIPELDSAAKTRRFDPDWILSCIPVKEFYDRWIDGSIEVRNFGAIINLVTANVQILVAAIDHQEGWSGYLQGADANWEVAMADEAPSLRFRPVGELTAQWESGSDRVSAPAVLLDSRLQEHLTRG